MLKKASFLVAIILSSCGTFEIVETSNTIDIGKNVGEIIGDEISSMIHVPSDYIGLESGDRFVSIQLPGRSLLDEDLSFAKRSGQDFFVPIEIDRAYLFSNWVNALSVIDLGLNPNGSLLSDYYVNQLNTQHLNDPTSELPSNFPLVPLTSATWNGDFFQTLTSYFFPEDSAWTNIQINKNDLDTFQVGHNVVVRSVPNYTIGTSVQLMPIVRPWFKPEYLVSSSENEVKRAYIESIIVARGLDCTTYEGSTSVSKFWKKRAKEISATPYLPSNTLQIKSATVIGYVYKIL